MTTIKVLIADDYDIVRRGLVVLLENFDEVTLIGAVADGQAALDCCCRERPDVVLMDVIMPGMDGISATRRIRQAYPDVQVIALTSFEDEDKVHRAIQAGAISYLLKNISGRDLVEAINKAHNGQSTLSPEAVQALMHMKTGAALGADLTDRERQVLALIVKGLSNRQIGQRLAISHSTAKEHVSNILSKLGVTTRTQAASKALEHELVEF